MTVFAVRLRNVLNTFRRRVNKSSLTWWYVLKTSWSKAFWRWIEDAFKMFWRSLEDVLKKFLQGILEHVLKTSWRYLGNMAWRCLADVLKTSWKLPEHAFAALYEDIWPRRIYWSWSRLLEDVLKTYDSGKYIRLDQDILKTSSDEEDERFLQDTFVKTSICWEVYSLEERQK